jgi:hypothetical protein
MDKISAIQEMAFQAGYEAQLEKIAAKAGFLSRAGKAVSGAARRAASEIGGAAKYYGRGVKDLGRMATKKGRGQYADLGKGKITGKAMKQYAGKKRMSGKKLQAAVRNRMIAAGGITAAGAGGGGYAAYRAARDE